MSKLFNSFGDRLMPPHPLDPPFNIENRGKSASTGPIKPNEPLKKGAEAKKTFLCNTGKALQSTPLRQVFSPRAVNVGALIYNDADDDAKSDDADAKSDDAVNFEELEFTRPVYKYDNYIKDCLDYMPEPEPGRLSLLPPRTPPPNVRCPSMELDDADAKSDDAVNFEELEFTRPVYKYDNYIKDCLDYMPEPEPGRLSLSPPRTPPPNVRCPSMELDFSYQYDFFTDDFSNESIPDPNDSDLGLPALY